MLGDRLRNALRRLRRVERREVREFRVWLENTRNLLHLSVVLFVPLLVGVVTMLSNALSTFSFFLFPPLAAGTYTLFADPAGRYSSPVRFVAGLTAGAICGWVAFEVGAILHAGPGAGVRPGSAAMSVLFTGVVTWAFDIEEPSAFSSALLVLVADAPEGGPALGGRLGYVVSIAVSSAIVAAVFVVWRREFYSERARYLYQSTKGDDHVLVPMRGDHTAATAMLAARLAAAHDAGKVVLLGFVDESVDADGSEAELEAEAETGTAETGGTPDDAGAAADGGSEDADASPAERRAAGRIAADLEERAAAIRTRVGVPCEVVVAGEDGSSATTAIRTAHETNCDLIATGYEIEQGALSSYVRELFQGDVDVAVHRSCDGRTKWKRVLVPVRRAGDVAHEMLDFATRLAGRTGRVSVCRCIDRESDRRAAESMLANLVETVSAACETRVSRADIADFLGDSAGSYDLVIMGSSGDRTTASRLVARPTFERVADLDADVIVLDRNRP
jgi:hypothetical protein